MGLCLAYGVGSLIPELDNSSLEFSASPGGVRGAEVSKLSKVTKPKSGLSTLLTSLHPLVASLAIGFCLSVVPELLLTVNFHLL